MTHPGPKEALALAPPPGPTDVAEGAVSEMEAKLSAASASKASAPTKADAAVKAKAPTKAGKDPHPQPAHKRLAAELQPSDAPLLKRPATAATSHGAVCVDGVFQKLRGDFAKLSRDAFLMRACDAGRRRARAAGHDDSATKRFARKQLAIALRLWRALQQ